ncbi:MAG: ATP synthase subunit I [Desulfuromonadaceae bacterium]|nr:ATP synthase subunit I [Desulfuromonas sp.]MDY0185495.1 ATP synthase subunit I [Desulfuromonadaceae bacterium]
MNSLLELADHLAHEVATNPSISGVILALIGGTILGLAFFGTLYWTVQRATFSQQPWLWFSLSLGARFSLLIAGLYLAGRSGTLQLLGCAVGIVLGRFMVQRLVRTPR